MTSNKQEKPWIPRMHLFEIDDQPWFPSFLRKHVQEGLTHAWNFCLPPLQSQSPAAHVAETLRQTLGDGTDGAARYTYIDFCAGAGGPTPDIERALNRRLAAPASTSTSNGNGNGAPSYAAVASTAPTRESRNKKGTTGGSDKKEEKKRHKKDEKSKSAKCKTRDDDREEEGVRFVLTDLHPHTAEWEAACKKSDHLSYIAEPVDASAATAELIARHTAPGKKAFRLYNLAFHHFDDGLARAMLKNTLETSDGFGIFELQERTLSSFLTCFIFGLFVMLIAPLAWPMYYLGSPSVLFFVYAVPVVPFVLVFDGLVSSVRTRTPDEVEALLRTCGADARGWELRSGRRRFLWPCGYMSWIICTKK